MQPLAEREFSPPKEEVQPSPVQILPWLALILVAWMIFSFTILFASLATTVVPSPLVNRNDIKAVTPQGWSFFSRDPREADLELYARGRGVQGTWTEVALGPNGATENALGLSREARARLMEIGAIHDRISSRHWLGCRGAVNQCKVGKLSNSISSPASDPYFCGEFILLRKEVLPWAWARSGSTAPMPYQAARFDIGC